MYHINFCEPDNNAMQFSSTSLECKEFRKLMYQVPSDRHAYSCRFYPTPIRYQTYTKLFYQKQPDFILNKYNKNRYCVIALDAYRLKLKTLLSI